MNYHKIEKASIANGTGVRVVLWVSGCSLHCKGCQNPSTWSYESGEPFDEDAKIKLFKAINKSYIEGITFSGGHPLERRNLNDVYYLIAEIKDKFPNKNIWLYTGFTFEDIVNKPEYRKIIELCDIIVDGKYIEELNDITLKWRGSSNQRVIDVKETLKKGEIVLYNK